jgi:hypothetical protein
MGLAARKAPSMTSALQQVWIAETYERIQRLEKRIFLENKLYYIADAILPRGNKRNDGACGDAWFDEADWIIS